MLTKSCRRCREEKSVDDFHRNSSARDGLQAYCKPCMLKAVRKSQIAHPRPRVSGTLGVRSCQGCGEEFVYSRGPGGARKFCSDECRAEYEALRKKFASIRRSHERAVVVDCGICGEPFESRHKGLKYCSFECREAAKRLARVKFSYGLSPAGYSALVTRADGCCEACGEPFAEGETPHVDHCHAAEVNGEMVVRGLLHGRCNHALGLTKSEEDAADRWDVAFSWAVYLARHEFDLRDLCAT